MLRDNIVVFQRSSGASIMAHARLLLDSGRQLYGLGSHLLSLNQRQNGVRTRQQAPSTGALMNVWPLADKQHGIALILPLGLYVIFLSRTHFLAPGFTPLTLMSLSGCRASLLLKIYFYYRAVEVWRDNQIHWGKCPL